MTNFAFVMDILKIPSKKFLEFGFDKSLVSRWRRGKLRLMPNRHIVHSISKLFWEVDAKSYNPVLQKILNVWYPAEQCNTEIEKNDLLERFLTEKEQMETEYEERRMARLGKLPSDAKEPYIISKGIESAKLRLLDFLDLIIASPNSTSIISAYPQGRGALALDMKFNTKVLDRYEKIFKKGHKMDFIIRSDDAISNFSYSYNKWLLNILNGQVRQRYFDDFNAYNTDVFLAVVNNAIAIELIEEQPGDLDSIISAIYVDDGHIADISNRIQIYSEHSKKREYLGFFDNSDSYLKYVHISPDSPCYIFNRLPHFGILQEDDFAKAFSLSETEKQLLNQELKPMLLNPEFFWDYAAVRHIFCESDIENALLKKRHQSMELSRMLKRRVWMSTQALVRQLKKILNLLETHKNYEVCFLSDERFDELKIQLALWGYGASVVWTDEKCSLASRGYTNQRIIQGFCYTVWDNIPAKMKSRAAAIHKIEQWLEKARRYGYEVT